VVDGAIGAPPAAAPRPPPAKPKFGSFAPQPAIGKKGVKAKAAPARAAPKAKAGVKAVPTAAGMGAEGVPVVLADAAVPAKKARKPAEAIDAAANDAEVRRCGASGELAKLTVPMIKAFLKANQTPGGLGGTKPVLLVRLAAFLGVTAPDAPAPAAAAAVE
jgi:hypothetical protein